MPYFHHPSVTTILAKLPLVRGAGFPLLPWILCCLFLGFAWPHHATPLVLVGFLLGTLEYGFS